MKLVEINDVRVGQVLERDRCIFVIEERTGAHNFAVSLYCHNHKPAPNDAYEEQSTRERNVATFDDCEIIGKIGITHRTEDGKLVEIPHTTEFEVDDIVRHENGKTGVIVKINNVGFAIGYEYSINCGSEGFNDTFEYLTKIGILGVTHEFVNDREA